MPNSWNRLPEKNAVVNGCTVNSYLNTAMANTTLTPKRYQVAFPMSICSFFPSYFTHLLLGVYWLTSVSLILLRCCTCPLQPASPVRRQHVRSWSECHHWGRLQGQNHQRRWQPSQTGHMGECCRAGLVSGVQMDAGQAKDIICSIENRLYRPISMLYFIDCLSSILFF